MLLLIIVGIILLVFFFFMYIEGNQNYWTKDNIHQVNNRDVHGIWDRYTFQVPFQDVDIHLYKAFKKVKDIKIGGNVMFRHPILYILDLDLVKNILVKDFDHFVNRRGIDFSDPKFKLMLFNMVGQEWKDLRAAMTPTFTTSKMRRMFGVFNESGNKMVNFLRKEIDSNGCEIELRDVCGRYTMDVIASSAFGVDSKNFENKNSHFAVNGRKLQDNFGKGIMIKFMFMVLFPKLANYFEMTFFNGPAFDFLESVVKDSIRRRKENGEKRNDFLQLMLEAQEESNVDQPEETLDQYDLDAQLDKANKMKLTDELLIAQCNLFFVAGFDSTETLLIWATYELALRPDIQEKLYEGLSLAINGNKEELTYEAVNSVEYLDMVVSEVLRKYPAGVRSERKCNKDYRIPGDKYVIKKDTHILIPTYAIHHDPEIYPDPQKFDPERFNAENKANRHPYAYLPFGLGPRSCIANRFAMMEGKAAIAHLVLNFKLSPGKKTQIPAKFTPKAILKPQNGMWLHLEPRN